RFHNKASEVRILKILSKGIGVLILFGVVSYVTVKVADPYLFQTDNFFDFRPNTRFVQNLKALESFIQKDAWYPPAVQWIHKPFLLFGLFNLSIAGLGLPYFILSCIGIIIGLKEIRRIEISIITFWALLFFLYQTAQIAP